MDSWLNLIFISLLPLKTRISGRTSIKAFLEEYKIKSDGSCSKICQESPKKISIRRNPIVVVLKVHIRRTLSVKQVRMSLVTFLSRMFLASFLKIETKGSPDKLNWFRKY